MNREFASKRGEQLVERIFDVTPEVRDVAVYHQGALLRRARPGVSAPTPDEAERHAEILVHPALLTLARQRGSLEGEAMHYVVVRYGNCFRWIRPLPDGHASVGLEPDADLLRWVPKIDGLVDEWLGRQ